MGFLQQGGPVLWVILGACVVAMAAFVERGFHLHRAKIKSDDFVKGILNILRRKNIDEALAICEETPGPVARVVRTAILHRESKKEFMEEAVNDSGLSEIARLEARVGVISTVAQIAPLLGLLGTVLGIVTLLNDMHGSQWQHAEVTAGLGQALITTAAGLTAAILCHVSYNLVIAKIEALVIDMERAASEIRAFITTSK
jgi:biopolymer transport protein ExbB